MAFTVTNRFGSIAAVLAAGAALLLSAPAATQAPQAQAAPVDLSGSWELRDDSKHIKPAELLPQAKTTQQQFSDILLHASRWCHPMGVPFVFGDSAPLDFVQNKRELAIIAEVQSTARHIYLDGRQHPDPDTFDPTSVGSSIGRWEGNVLVVDTVGFNEIGHRGIPGGGLRGPTTHLVERYELRNGGKELNIQFTWTDPNVFAKPHTYDFTYYRAPADEYAREYFCDASDPARTRN